MDADFCRARAQAAFLRWQQATNDRDMMDARAAAEAWHRAAQLAEAGESPCDECDMCGGCVPECGVAR